MEINSLILDGEEWWASQAIDDTDSLIRSLLKLAIFCIELKIRLEDAKQLFAELSLHNNKHCIELETHKWLAFCADLSDTAIAKIAKQVEAELNTFAAKHLK